MPDGPVIVCGMGHVGYRVALLLRRLGQPVTVVTDSAREAWLASAREAGVEVLIGDARDERLVTRAGLAEARAIIAATDVDLVNVEIMLDAQRLRPGVPIVVRIFDRTLAAQLESSFAVRRALATSSLAAPAFAAAAMGEHVIASVQADETVLVAGRVSAREGDALAGRTPAEAAHRAGLALMGVRRRGGDGSAREEGERVLQPGDQIVAIGPQAAWDALRPSEERAAAISSSRIDARGAPDHHRGPIAFLRDMWRQAPSALRLLLAVLVGLSVMSGVVFGLGLGLSPVDAVYYVVTTVTTTGYGDITPLRAAPWLKLYASLLMVIGSATVAVLYSIITDYLVASRVLHALGRQRPPQRDHVVLAGLGNLGYRVASELRRSGVAVVAIDKADQVGFAEALREDLPIVTGDARLHATLCRAGAERARAVVAVTSDDTANLAAALEARRINPGIRTVTRLFDAEFARKVQTSLGIDRALSASAVAAPTFAAAALHEDVLRAFLDDDQLFALVLRACPDAWSGLSPKEIAARFGLLPLLHRRDGKERYSPCDPRQPIEAGARIVAVVCHPLVAPAGQVKEEDRE